MLGKLIKYEFKSYSRVFFPLYIAILVVATMSGASMSSMLKDENNFMLDNSSMITWGFLNLVFVALFVALIVVTIVLIIQRFSKNLLSDEGYLMFTLPVKISSLILSKLLVALIFAIFSGLIACLSFLIIIFINYGGDTGFYVSTVFYSITEIGKSTSIILLVYLILVMIINYIVFVLSAYLSLSVGQLPKLNKYKIPFSAVTFFIINTIISKIMISIRSSIISNPINDIISQKINPKLMTCMSIDVLVPAAICVVMFLAINYILSKKLNLE